MQNLIIVYEFMYNLHKGFPNIDFYVIDLKMYLKYMLLKHHDLQSFNNEKMILFLKVKV